MSIENISPDKELLWTWWMQDAFNSSIDYRVFTLEYELVEAVSKSALVKMMVEHGDALDIPRRDRLNFAGADAIAKVRDADGGELYLAFEVSYVVRWGSTRRAIRNAEIISRITGLPARPAVAGPIVEKRARDAIDRGETLFVAMYVKLEYLGCDECAGCEVCEQSRIVYGPAFGEGEESPAG